MRNDEQVANEWLKQNGIAVKHMDKMDLCLQQAQMVATNLLTHHANWLNSEQHSTLTTYITTEQIRARQNKACRAMAYKVLNIGKQMNRELFKQHRNTNTHR